jgi:hypothetical protein
MTRKKLALPTMPYRAKPKPINLPTYWSPEQVTAVFEFVDLLRDRILGHYELQIQEFLRKDRVTTTPFTQSGIDENDVPF